MHGITTWMVWLDLSIGSGLDGAGGDESEVGDEGLGVVQFVKWN